MVKRRISPLTLGAYVLTIAVLVGLLRYPAEVSLAVTSSLSLCIKAVIPSLFPFLIVSSLIISTGLAAKTGRLLSPSMRLLFKLPGEAGVAFFIGILSGYPVGASTTVSLYESKACSRAEAERLLAFCNNTGPAFVVGSVGIGMFGSIKAGVILYFIHIISALLSGIIISLPIKKHAFTKSRCIIASPVPFSKALVNAVRKSAENTLYIVGFVSFFSVIIQMTDLLFLISNPILTSVISGIFEVTSGINTCAGAFGLSPISLILSSAILSWGGLSVHAQVASVVSDTDLSLRFYIIGKALHTFLSALLTFVLLIL